jgi:GNAT superfamily N-acetyltransferase
MLHHLHFFSAYTAAAIPSHEHSFRLLNAPGLLPPLPQQFQQFRDVHARRFAAGHAAVVSEYEGAVAFIAWLAFRELRVDELALTWRIPSQNAVLYDVYTMPEHRGKGLYPAALVWAKTKLGELNISRCWIYAERSNAASLRGIAKAGFEYAGNMRSLRIGGYALRTGKIEGSGL